MEVGPEAGLRYPWAVVAVHTSGLVWAEALNFFLKFRNDLKSWQQLLNCLRLFSDDCIVAEAELALGYFLQVLDQKDLPVQITLQ